MTSSEIQVLIVVAVVVLTFHRRLFCALTAGDARVLFYAHTVARVAQVYRRGGGHFDLELTYGGLQNRLPVRGFSRPPLAVGERISVYYNPREPKQAVPDLLFLRVRQWWPASPDAATQVRSSEAAEQPLPASVQDVLTQFRGRTNIVVNAHTDTQIYHDGDEVPEHIQAIIQAALAGKTGTVTEINWSSDDEVPAAGWPDALQGLAMAGIEGGESATFKVLELIPRFERGANAYDVVGELQRAGDRGAERVTTAKTLTAALLPKVAPGQSVVCQVWDEPQGQRIAFLFSTTEVYRT